MMSVGAFGLKGMGFPEQPLVLFAAKRVGRPVLWIGERSESFIADNAARDHVTEITLALDSDLRMLALSVDTTANMGAYLSTFALNMPTLVYGRVMGGAYAIPAIHMRTRCVYHQHPARGCISRGGRAGIDLCGGARRRRRCV